MSTSRRTLNPNTNWVKSPPVLGLQDLEVFVYHHSDTYCMTVWGNAAPELIFTTSGNNELV